MLVDPLEIFQTEVMGTKRLLDGKTILSTKSYGYIFISFTFYFSTGRFTLNITITSWCILSILRIYVINVVIAKTLLLKSINNDCLNGSDNFFLLSEQRNLKI